MAINDHLINAVIKGDAKQVRELLIQGADPNTKKKKKSLLDLVSPNEHEVKCELIEAGARQTSLKRELVWAISKGRRATVEALLQYGADLNMDTPMGTPLMTAITSQQVDLVEQLISLGADVNVSSGFSTPLTRAIDENIPELMEMLLKAGCHPDLTPQYVDQQALEYAILHNSVACARLLLESAADPNFTSRQTLMESPVDGSGETFQEMPPLQLAAVLGRGEFVKLLLAHEVDVLRRCGQGKTALQWARERGHKALSQLLAEHIPEPQDQDPDEQLLRTSEAGELSQVKAALSRGAKLEARDSRTKTKGFTALQLAASRNRFDVVTVLLEHSAEVDAGTGGEKIPSYLLSNIDDPDTLIGMGYSLNRTALIWALIHKNTDMALALLIAGADPNLCSHIRETPMVLAAGLNHVDLLEAFKAAGAQPDKAGGEKQTPLMMACAVGAANSARWLLQNKAKTNRKNSEGETPMSLACAGGHIETLRLLLESGADPEFKSEWGSPLVSAARAMTVVPYTQGQESFISVSYTDQGATTYAPLEEHVILEMVQILLEAGVCPNDNSGGFCALGCASHSGQLEVVKCLLAGGARLGTKDGSGNTPLDLAKMFNRQIVVEYLESLGIKSTPAKSVADEAVDDYKAVFAPIPKLGKKLKSKSFLNAIERLEEACRSRAVILDNHVETHVDTSLLTELNVAELQEEFSELGYFLVECSGSFSLPQKMALLPSPRWQDALAIFQTNGINYDVASQNVIDWFEEWEPVNPVRILTVKDDVVAGVLRETVKKPRAYAESMYELCPDTVEQGMGTLEALTEELVQHGNFYLWWD